MSRRSQSRRQHNQNESVDGISQAVVWLGVSAIVLSMVLGVHAAASAGFPLLLVLVCLSGVVALLPWGGARTWRRVMRDITPVALLAAAQVLVY
jgi:hypothetical protein